jgi:Ca-activated chloride channel family protein
MTGQELTFAYGQWWPLVLLGLALVVGGFVWLSLWRRKVTLRLADSRLAGRLIHVSPARRAIKRVLLTLALVLSGLALLRPQFGTEETQVQGLGIDLAVALDISNSMLVADIAPDRLTGSRMEIGELLDRMEGGRVSLVPFAGIAYAQSPLTSDFGALRIFLRDLSPLDVPVPGTAIGRALNVALDTLLPPEERSNAREDEDGTVEVKPFAGSKYKAILLITDGEDHGSAPLEVARKAKARGIRIYTVGVGSTVGDLVPKVDEAGRETGDKVTDPDSGDVVVSRLNDELLTEIAELTGGKYFHYNGSPVAQEIYEEIEQLEKREYAALVEELRIDRYQFLLLPVFLLLLLELGLSERRWRP